MLKYFAAIVSFCTLVGTSHAFLKGMPFYFAVALSLLLAASTIVAWPEDRAKHRDRILKYLEKYLECVDAEAVSHIVTIGRERRNRSEVVELLVVTIREKIDPTQRYWLYVALGMIGGKKAKSAVRKGLSDDSKFARLGAESAMTAIMMKPSRRHLQWSLVFLIILVCAVIGILRFSQGNHPGLPTGASQLSQNSTQQIITQGQHRPDKTRSLLRIDLGKQGEMRIIVYDADGTCSEVSIKYTDAPLVRYIEFTL